ncbi:MAG: type II secretion system F family protein [Nanoarchaeota archaeon]|nr:type II secretion system F family protein [Nanoarchaeota archaeon]MBU1321980.1 type II secretion system F family protein [Nanoarchaeota archaeon]MBU1597632.1 type II secretion system F family protein [Nanoarchaeota archaeon]MBU2442036.1 type II secretion system F family protein [Nanoarchaeota archaeon]
MPKNQQTSKALLKKKLMLAGINKSPEDFMSQTLKNSLIIGVLMAVFSFFIISKKELPLIFVPVVGFVFFVLAYTTLYKVIDSKISRKAKKIDKDVLFAGRFLLIKLNSGRPLINSFMEASRSYGVASNYFKEIIRDIDLGTPLEKALDKATDSCPSKKMKRILFQINNALQIGIDVSQNLEAVLEEIAAEQLVEIQRYGKKLNSLTLFYMLLAVVVPSLGMTMFIIIAGLVSLSITASTFFVFLFFLLLVELVFLSLFKGIRPNVNI